jgi:phospholipase C
MIARGCRFVATLLLLVVTVTFSGCSLIWAQAESDTTTPIKHVVMLMQENHSFDNYFGTYPGADGLPADVCMPRDPNDPAVGCVKPFHIGESDVAVSDPDHSDSTSRLQYNDGKMNGFISALNTRNQDGRMAMGYYDDRDLPYYWNLADRYVLFDRFFSSASGGSGINHMYWVAAAPGGKVEKHTPINDVLTIFDRLEEREISWKFYIQNYEPKLNYRTLDQFPGNRGSQVIWAPLLYMDRFIDDPALSAHIVNLDEYYTDLQNGTLPSVAFIAPSGPSEHPPSNIQSGQRFVRGLIQVLMRSQAWSASAFLVAYDDWGGWYDHVPPPQVDEHGFGFRVPAFLVSPYAREGYIDHTELDYTSVLKFIEDNFRLEPLANRDARANSIASAFDFAQPPRVAEYIPWDRTPDRPPTPRRGVIYLIYGGAAGLMGLLVLGATAGDESARLANRANAGIRRRIRGG